MLIQRFSKTQETSNSRLQYENKSSKMHTFSRIFCDRDICRSIYLVTSNKALIARNQDWCVATSKDWKSWMYISKCIGSHNTFSLSWCVCVGDLTCCSVKIYKLLFLTRLVSVFWKFQCKILLVKWNLWMCL